MKQQHNHPVFSVIAKRHLQEFKKNICRVIIPTVFISCFISCDDNKGGNTNDMKGAFSMYRQVVNDGTKDSVIDRNQMKIYTDHHIMYASSTGIDSFASYGIGTYAVKNGKITEYIFYRSSTGETKDTAVLQIENSGTGYMQVINEILVEGKKYKLTEQYDKVSKDLKSPLDGAWKQTNRYNLDKNGDTSAKGSPLQYKVYQDGNYIWAQTYRDSSNKNVSVFGYGTFEMDGKNKSRETTLNSTFRTALMGKTYELLLEFTGNDAYKQVIEFRNGTKSVELYQRLKE